MPRTSMYVSCDNEDRDIDNDSDDVNFFHFCEVSNPHMY
jgi:hypothetical protein